MGGGGKGSSTSKSAPPPEIMEAYKKSIGYAGQAISKPYEQYQGQLVAGLNPTQLQAMANVNSAQGAALPYIQQGASYANQAAQGVNPGMINQFMSPYLNTVVNATQKNLLESNAQQLAGLKGQAIQSGAFGGDRSRFAQAEMARQQGLANGQVIGGLLNQGYGQALSGAQQNIQSMMQGGQMLGGLGQAAQQSILQGAQAQMAAGSQQQATEQAGLQSLYDQFLQRQAFPFQQAQFYANIAQGIGAGAGGTTTQTPAAPNLFSQIVGGATAAAPYIAMSDERVKENIEPVGKTYDGQNIYRYNYKGDPKTQIGLIAQEVEKKHPDAVVTLGGIKMVNYADATEDAAKRSGKAFGGSSMGGLVSPGMEREAFAQGGFGGVPYADFMKTMSWMPEGALSSRGQSPGSTLPRGFSPEELEKIASGSSFDPINSMSEKDVANVKAGLGKIGTSSGLMPASNGAEGMRAPAYSGPLSSFGPGVGSFFSNVGSALGFADGGGVIPRHGYATDGAVEFIPPDPEEVKQHIIETAKAKGIDPNEALKVYASEGLAGDPNENWQSKIVKNGVREESYGPFQLNMGPQGLGTAMLKNTGVDPRDPKNWKAGVEFGLAEAKKSGWKPWMGAAKIGLTGAVSPYESDTGGVVPLTENPEVTQAPAGVVPQIEDTAQTNITPTADQPSGRRRSIIESILGQDLSDQARMGITAAGLAMLGGRSPYFGVNVGQGAMAGLNTYYKGLENQRELTKMGAELGLRKYEAETGRMTAETARQQMVRQLYMQILPLVQFYQAEGRPVPPQYQKIIDEAMQLGVAGEASATAASKIPAPSNAPIATDGTAAPVASEPTVNGTEAPAATPVVGEAPAPQNTEATAPADVELAKPDTAMSTLFSRLPDDQNPYKLYEKAAQAPTKDLKEFYLTQARETLKDYKEKGVLLDGEIIPLPGMQESAARGKKLETQATNSAEYEKEIGQTLPARYTSLATLERLATLLTKLQTGPIETQINEIGNIAADLGVDVGDPTNYQKFVKDATVELFAKLATVPGGRILVSEIEGLKKQANDPNLTEGANAAILAQAIGTQQWNIKKANDYQAWVSDPKNKDPYNFSKFEADWLKKPENNQNAFVRSAADKIDYKGKTYPNAPFTNKGLDVEKLQVGKGYNFPIDASGKKFAKGWYYGPKEDGSPDIRPTPPPF